MNILNTGKYLEIKYGGCQFFLEKVANAIFAYRIHPVTGVSSEFLDYSIREVLDYLKFHGFSIEPSQIRTIEDFLY